MNDYDIQVEARGLKFFPMGEGYWIVSVPVHYGARPEAADLICRELLGDDVELLDKEHPVYGAAMLTVECSVRESGGRLELLSAEDYAYELCKDRQRSLFYLRVLERGQKKSAQRAVQELSVDAPENEDWI